MLWKRGESVCVSEALLQVCVEGVRIEGQQELGLDLYRMASGWYVSTQPAGGLVRHRPRFEGVYSTMRRSGAHENARLKAGVEV